MTTISTKTILRSRHSQNPNLILSTLLIRYPRPIHAEFMTHRMLSKNAASSRAIPVSKLIQDVMDDPFVPLVWGKNQKGMQSTEECDEPIELDGFVSLPPAEAWLFARDQAVEMARNFAEAGYHKQIVNRLLEPFAHITVVVSGTEWSNFRALRDHPDAEPHIQILAREIGKELDREDNIQILNPGEWHMPFINLPEDNKDIVKYLTCDGVLRKFPFPAEIDQIMIKKSVACCASTSYKTVDGFDMTLERAIDLHDKLVGSTPLHASPAEHVAQADRYDEIEWLHDRQPWANAKEHGNFRGFRQYRKMLPNECL